MRIIIFGVVFSKSLTTFSRLFAAGKKEKINFLSYNLLQLVAVIFGLFDSFSKTIMTQILLNRMSAILCMVAQPISFFTLMILATQLTQIKSPDLIHLRSLFIKTL